MPRRDRKDDVDDTEQRGRNAKDQPLRIAQRAIDDERERDRRQAANPERSPARREVGQPGAERQHAAGDEDEPVELHPRVAPADEGEKKIEAGGEVDEEES